MEMMFFAIVNRGKANAILRKAQEHGAKGGTIFLGEGTVQLKLLEKLGLTETHKEILMMPASEELCEVLFNKLDEEFSFKKRNKGIAFSIPFRRHHLKDGGHNQDNEASQNDFTHYCIITIVDQGKAKECIKAARAAGARGGTLIHGRGAGVPTDFSFPLIIEPQKDIVMIITPKDKLASIRDGITSDLELEKVGNGIVFVLPVLKTIGLFENRLEERKEAMS